MKITTSILAIFFALTLSFSATACDSTHNDSDTESLSSDILARINEEINEE